MAWYVEEECDFKSHNRRNYQGLLGLFILFRGSLNITRFQLERENYRNHEELVTDAYRVYNSL